jgi:putative hydrolase of the HAD superfamily
VVDSSSAGVRKPDPRIFHIALEHLDDTSPQEVVFLDDYPANVEAARALGMHALLVGSDLQATIRELDALLAS